VESCGKLSRDDRSGALGTFGFGHFPAPGLKGEWPPVPAHWAGLHRLGLRFFASGGLGFYASGGQRAGALCNPFNGGHRPRDENAGQREYLATSRDYKRLSRCGSQSVEDRVVAIEQLSSFGLHVATTALV
jgi:hypothetical protein